MKIKSYILNKKTMLFLRLKFKNRNCIIRSCNISKDIDLQGFNTIGEKVYISHDVKVGKYTYFNSDYDWINIESNVIIGSFCSIGPGVSIGYGNHDFNKISTHPFLYNSYYHFVEQNDNIHDEDKITIIGNDVWIGAKSNIKRGVKIGDGAIIAMNSVVTKDVPPYSIVAGVPAKVIKYRFNEDNIKTILNSKWWLWDNNYIKENIKKFNNIQEFKKIKKNS